MTPIPPKLRKQIDQDPFYKTCALYGQHGHVCSGRITMDHSIIFGGRQLQELWAIGPFCEAAHGVDNHADNAQNKELRLWVALNRANSNEILRISKAVNYSRMFFRLNEKLGEYSHKVPEAKESIEMTAKAVQDKPFWYPVNTDQKERIDRICLFNKEVLGMTTPPFAIIRTAIESFYTEMAEQVKANEDEDYYKKYGFDK